MENVINTKTLREIKQKAEVAKAHFNNDLIVIRAKLADVIFERINNLITEAVQNDEDNLSVAVYNYDNEDDTFNSIDTGKIIKSLMSKDLLQTENKDKELLNVINRFETDCRVLYLYQEQSDLPIKIDNSNSEKLIMTIDLRLPDEPDINDSSDIFQ